MKTKILTLLLTILIPGLRSLQAQDALASDKVTITGSITQDGTNGRTTTKPITIANVLGVLGVSGTNSAKTLRYYLDTTTESFVIAPKVLAVSGSGTPVATVYAIDTATVEWSPTSKSATNGGDNTLMNGNLSGAHLLNGVISHGVETDMRKFIAFGTISGVQTIMKGTIVDIYSITQ